MAQPAIHLHTPFMLRRAATLLGLSDGWDGGVARAPTTSAFDAARWVIDRLVAAGLEASRVVADVEGGIGLDFHIGPTEAKPQRYASFLCDNDGAVVVVLRTPQDYQVWDLEQTDQAMAAAIARVRAFLGTP